MLLRQLDDDHRSFTVHCALLPSVQPGKTSFSADVPKALELRGEFLKTEFRGVKCLLFLGSPRFLSLSEMKASGFTLLDLPQYDASRELLDISQRFNSLEIELDQAKSLVPPESSATDDSRIYLISSSEGVERFSTIPPIDISDAFSMEPAIEINAPATK
jgi:hypothetical protein